MWDPDGPGPAGEQLVLCGQFYVASSPEITNVARWDGTQWQPIGKSFDGAVYAVAVHDGRLFAGGAFTTMDEKPMKLIAQWSGAAWEPLGTGISTNSAFVTTLTSFGGSLIVGGEFSQAGAVANTNGIARWDGASWSSIGGVAGQVSDVIRFSNGLAVVGIFAGAGGVPARNVAYWDGVKWTAFGTGIPGAVMCAAVFENELVVGGSFTTASGSPTNFLARWNGSQWLPLANQSSRYWTRVIAMTVHRGELYIGGILRNDQYVSANVQKWNGTTWTDLPEAFDFLRVTTLFGIGDDVFAIGTGDPSKARLWNGESWRAIGSGFSGAVLASTTFRGELVVGGQFDTAGGVGARNIARWDGNSWRPLGSGTDGRVTALVEFNGNLIAGGYFREAGGKGVVYLARWNGDNWAAMHPPGTVVGSSGFVGDLVVYQGALFGCGQLHVAGSTSTHAIGRWDGTQWQPVGDGILYSNREVRRLVVYGSDLVAGGTYFRSGSVSMNCVGRWDGLKWSPLGLGLGRDSAPSVDAMEVVNSELIVGGLFTSAGGLPLRGLVKWNGQQWSALSNQKFDGSVEAMTLHEGKLYFGGSFGIDNPSIKRRLGSWSGSTLQAIPGELNASIQTLHSSNGEVVVGGYFSRLDGAHNASLARWTGSNTPWVAVSPADFKTQCKTPDATFETVAASGYAPASYRWQRSGVPISDGTTAWGSVIEGAATPLLIVRGARVSDAGIYDCVISTECADSVSRSAALVFEECCVGDLNQDRYVDDLDFERFVQQYDVLDCADAAMPLECLADWNRDGFVDDSDFVLFVSGYKAWACQ